MHIVICTSASFYKQALEVAEKLESQGFTITLPLTAHTMKASGDFDVSHHRTWLTNAEDYTKKTHLMRTHFEDIAKGDAILVLNYEKNGVPGYIGGNVLMEMGLAFYLKKPIYILNSVPDILPNYEEVMGVYPIILNGDLTKITL
ncbi:MAG TPA: hypothetical protein DDW36_00815 [Candidatus Magasanikbacteria bacterium]|nr:hypothetical protein [Candidatus Magasanikbacteria bacterium]